MEGQKESSEGEDIPSDFFDDFAKDDFIKGLSVIDRWDNDENKHENACVEPENLHGVQDLRELIARERKEEHVDYADRCSSHSKLCIDDFIKPGSRRDPNKTNRAIKKDKELKVKEHLAKHLESSSELCPPGTELDDFFEENKSMKKKEQPSEERLSLSSPTKEESVSNSARQIQQEPEYSPLRKRRSPPTRHRNSPGRYPSSPGRLRTSSGRLHTSPGRLHTSPGRLRTSPGRLRTSPGRFRTSPGRFRTSPGRFRTSPGRFRTSPGRFHTSPGRFHTSPGRYHTSPGRFHTSPGRFRDSPGSFRQSPGRFRDSPGRFHHSRGTFRKPFGRYHELPTRHRESPTRHDRRPISSTHRKSPSHYRHAYPRRDSGNRSRSPQVGYRKERRYSSSRDSPLRTMRRDRSSRSPRESYRRSHSRSPRNKRDDFLYPDAAPNFIAHNPTFEIQPQAQFPGPTNMDYYVEPAVGPMDISIGPQVPQLYNVPQIPAYAGFNPPHPYANQPPQPVPAPVIPAPIIPAPVNAGLAPVLQTPQLNIDAVTSSNLVSTIGIRSTSSDASLEPSAALAKLVADGKLSHEDYLKLAPNKGVLQRMDTNTRVGVLNRCHSAMSKLSDLLPPNRLIVGNVKKMKPMMMKSIGPKFCSPLKKKPNVEFNFTKISVPGVEFQNKQIIDTIISSLDLHKVVGRRKKKQSNNMRDVAVQTTNPQCDLCVIRKATLVNEVGTSIDPEQFSCTTHTQVVEEDLQNSRSVFNPSGSTSDGAPISFAHMTPAQLVSQLVARAKTLRQTDTQQPNQYQGRGHYDGRGGSQNYRNNYNNYRY